MPAGRPSSYDPSICGDIPALFENGASIAKVCVELGISKKTFYNWQKEHEEFLHAVTRGLELSEAWWCEQAEKHLVIEHQGPRLDTALWKSNMANRFNWREKQDITTDDKPLPTGPWQVNVVDSDGDGNKG